MQPIYNSTAILATKEEKTMVIAFQIILMFIMLVSIFGVIGEKKDEKLRDLLAGAFVASLVAFIVSVMWL